MSHIIGKNCIGVKDGSCITVCPIEDCIMEGEDSMYINPDTCIDCGACIYECPVDAIFDSEEETIKKEGVEVVHSNYNFFKQKYKP